MTIEIPLPDGSVAVFPDDMPEAEMRRHIEPFFPRPPEGSGGLLNKFAQVAGDLTGGISAALQGTSPHVQKIGGEMNYRPLGEAGPLDSGGTGWIDAAGMHKIDPAQHVILNDPGTGKPMVYARSEDTNESVLSTLGRLLGFGTIASSNVPARAPAAAAERMIANRFGGPETQAQKFVGNTLRADIEAGGPGPLQIGEAMARAPTAVLPVDVAGENIRGLGGQVARVPGLGRTQIATTLNDRDELAGRILTGAVDTMATGGPGQSTFLAGRSLQEQAKNVAGPLYRQAEMQPALNPDLMAPGGELNALLQRDSMKNAARNAAKIAREEGVDPSSLGIKFDAAGEPAFEQVPSWRTLHYMKRGIDDVLDTYRNKLTGKLDLDEEGRAVLGTQQKYLAMLDRENPYYGAARAAWSGPKQSQSAMLRGENVFNKSPDEIASELAELSPTDRRFYQLGAANKLKEDLAKTSSGGDEARKLIGNVNRQDQLRAVFPDADKPGDLLDVARTEKLKFGTRHELLGGSQTAPRLAQDFSGGGGSTVLQPLAEGAIAAGAGEPMFGLKSMLSGLNNLLRGKQMNPQIAREIAGQLLQSDPALARAWLMQSMERTRPPIAGRPIF